MGTSHPLRHRRGSDRCRAGSPGVFAQLVDQVSVELFDGLQARRRFWSFSGHHVLLGRIRSHRFSTAIGDPRPSQWLGWGLNWSDGVSTLGSVGSSLRALITLNATEGV
jgi:hypothetical protein